MVVSSSKGFDCVGSASASNTFRPASFARPTTIETLFHPCKGERRGIILEARKPQRGYAAAKKEPHGLLKLTRILSHERGQLWIVLSLKLLLRSAILSQVLASEHPPAIHPYS